MFKVASVLIAIFACAFAKPGLVAPVAYSAPLVAAAPAVVTSSSSQVFARNYNGLAAPLIAAAAPVANTAPAIAAPLAYTASAVAPLAYLSPFGYSAGLVPSAYATPYAAPLKYTAAAPVLF